MATIDLTDPTALTDPADRSGGPRVVLVTGSTGGVGTAVTERFRAGGWTIVGVDRAPSSSADHHLVADLADVTQCRQAVERTVEVAGRLDGVVNAAGLWLEGPAEETTEEQWDRVVGLNLKGLFFVSAAAIPHLERTSGWITNLSSDAGVQGNTGAAVYCASKGGVTNLTRALALELAPRGRASQRRVPG